MARSENNILPNDFHQSPPEPTLPPVYPPLALHEAYKEKGIANINYTLKMMRFRGEEMCTEEAWQTLSKNKKQLKRLFIASNKGIKENRASKTRFYEIINEEMKHRTDLEKEIHFSHIELEDYKKVEQSMKYHVEKYSVYEKFLEEVAAVGDSWRNVGEILNRYETLRSTSQVCAKVLGAEMDQADELREQMVAVMVEKSGKLKTLSNRLILLQVHRKDARDKREFWEHMVQRIKNTVMDKSQEATILSMGMFDLYRSMCKRKRVSAIIPKTDIGAQIDFINKTIMFYKEVITIASGSKNVQPVKEVREKKRKLKKRRAK